MRGKSRRNPIRDNSGASNDTAYSAVVDMNHPANEETSSAVNDEQRTVATNRVVAGRCFVILYSVSVCLITRYCFMGSINPPFAPDRLETLPIFLLVAFYSGMIPVLCFIVVGLCLYGIAKMWSNWHCSFGRVKHPDKSGDATSCRSGTNGKTFMKE